jgi:hypothetical protein
MPWREGIMVNDGTMSYFAKIGLNVDEFMGGLSKSQGGLLAFARDVTVTMNMTMMLFDRVMAFGQKFVDLANNAGAFGKAITDNARDLGMSTNEFQRWTHAAIASGSSADEITSSIRQMSVKMKDAVDPTSEVAKTLKDLGVTVTDSSGNMRSMNDVMLDLLPAINNLPEGFDRNQASMVLFGRGFSNIADMTSLSRGELQKLLDQAPVFSPDRIANLNDYSTKMALMNEKVRDLNVELGEKLVPIMTDSVIPAFVAAKPFLEDAINLMDYLGEAADRAATGYAMLQDPAQWEKIAGGFNTRQARREGSRQFMAIMDSIANNPTSGSTWFDPYGLLTKKNKSSSGAGTGEGVSDLTDEFAGLTGDAYKLAVAQDNVNEKYDAYQAALKAGNDQKLIDKTSRDWHAATDTLDTLTASMAKNTEVVKAMYSAWASSVMVGTEGSAMQQYLQKEMEAGTSYEAALKMWSEGAQNTGTGAGTLGAVGKAGKVSSPAGIDTKALTKELDTQAAAYTSLNEKIVAGWVDLEGDGLTHYTAMSEMARIEYQKLMDDWDISARHITETIAYNQVITVTDGVPAAVPMKFEGVAATVLKAIDLSSVKLSGAGPTAGAAAAPTIQQTNYITTPQGTPAEVAAAIKQANRGIATLYLGMGGSL